MQAVAKWLSVNSQACVIVLAVVVTTDRRSLQSSASEHVATVWKALLEHIVDQEGSDIDIDVDEIVSVLPPYNHTQSRYSEIQFRQ